MKVILEENVLQDTKLDPFDKILMGFIESYSFKGKFNLDFKSLENALSVSKKKIQNSISGSLSKNGYVEIISLDDPLKLKIVSIQERYDQILEYQKKLEKEQESKEEQNELNNRQINVWGQEIIDHLNEKKIESSGRKGQYKYATNNKKLIIERFHDNLGKGQHRDKQQFITVIDNKFAQWSKDPKMKRYLTPGTLFAKKHFDDYLGQVPDVPESKKVGDENNNGW